MLLLCSGYLALSLLGHCTRKRLLIYLPFFAFKYLCACVYSELLSPEFSLEHLRPHVFFSALSPLLSIIALMCLPSLFALVHLLGTYPLDYFQVFLLLRFVRAFLLACFVSGFFSPHSFEYFFVRFLLGS